MNCPNCKKEVERHGDKIHCSACGWFEKQGDEWVVSEAPVEPAAAEPEPEIKDESQVASVPEQGTESTTDKNVEDEREIQKGQDAPPSPVQIESDDDDDETTLTFEFEDD